MSALPVSTETVIRLLRQLSPRERLRVVLQVLPELENELPPSTAPDFWQGADLQALADSQGVGPVAEFATLLGGWPDDEPIDDFLVALRASRRDNPAQVNAA